MKSKNIAIISGLSLIGYFSYKKLSSFLADQTVETSNYLRAENGETFFLDLSMIPDLPNLPLLKYTIDKIDLKINNEPVATSTVVNGKLDTFNQEFKLLSTTNYNALSGGANEAEAEITYKTIAGLKITKTYKLNLEDFKGNEASNNTTTEENNNCEIF